MMSKSKFMYNPEHQEKHLAPMDVKIKTRTTIVTVIVATAIVLGVVFIAQTIDKVISSMRSA